MSHPVSLHPLYLSSHPLPPLWHTAPLPLLSIGPDHFILHLNRRTDPERLWPLQGGCQTTRTSPPASPPSPTSRMSPVRCRHRPEARRLRTQPQQFPRRKSALWSKSRSTVLATAATAALPSQPTRIRRYVFLSQFTPLHAYKPVLPLFLFLVSYCAVGSFKPPKTTKH